MTRKLSNVYVFVSTENVVSLSKIRCIKFAFNEAWSTGSIGGWVARCSYKRSCSYVLERPLTAYKFRHLNSIYMMLESSNILICIWRYQMHVYMYIMIPFLAIHLERCPNPRVCSWSSCHKVYSFGVTFPVKQIWDECEIASTGTLTFCSVYCTCTCSLICCAYCYWPTGLIF